MMAVAILTWRKISIVKRPTESFPSNWAIIASKQESTRDVEALGVTKAKEPLVTWLWV